MNRAPTRRSAETPAFFPSWFIRRSVLAALAAACGLAWSPSVCALEGTRVGDCWTDNDGTNHCGDSGSSSSGSSYGWTYTYGYTGASAQAYDDWAARMQAAREARQLRAEYEAQQAVRRQALQLNDLGIQASKNGDFAQAADYYERAHNIDPSDPVILDNLNSARGSQHNEDGNRLYEAGDFEAAAKAYERALELKPQSDVIRGNLEDARRQLEYQREAAAKRDAAQEQMRKAKGRIQSQLSAFQSELSAPPVPGGGLSFKGGEGAGGQGRPGGDDDGLHPLAFKNMKPPQPALEQEESRPSGGSRGAWEQLKSVWFHGRQAVRAQSDEEASAQARAGFDTSGVPGSAVDPGAATDVPGIRGDAPIPASGPAAPAEPLRFKTAAPAGAGASSVPEFDPELSVQPDPAGPGPQFDPELAATILNDPKARLTLAPEFDPELAESIRYPDPSAPEAASSRDRYVPLSEENWEIIKKDPEVRDALTARDFYYINQQRKMDLLTDMFRDTYEGIKTDLRRAPEYQNASEAELTCEAMKNPRFQAVLSDINEIVVDERRARQEHELTIASAIEKKREKMWREAHPEDRR